MPTKMRRVVKIYVKTLTGNTLDVEMDLDDGEWRAQEGNSGETAKDAAHQEQGEDAKMDVVVDNSEAGVIEDTTPADSEATEPDSTSSTEKAKIRHLKQLVFEVQGIPPNQQRLVYQGKQLTDDDELDKTGLKDQTVHLVLALRGGCL